MTGDLRSFLRVLEEEGELVRVTEEVDPKYEVAAVIKEAGKRGGPALLFEHVKGYAMPVVGNLFGTARRLALALEAEPGREYEAYLQRKRQPVEPITNYSRLWAVATRCQPDVDTVILSDVPASPIDPSRREGLGIPCGGKIGLVATIPAGEEEKFRRVASPAASTKRALAILEHLARHRNRAFC